jgi:hypothetical protein
MLCYVVLVVWKKQNEIECYKRRCIIKVRTISALRGGDVVCAIGVVGVEVCGVQHDADGSLLDGQVLGAVDIHGSCVRNDRIVCDQVRILPLL